MLLKSFLILVAICMIVLLLVARLSNGDRERLPNKAVGYFVAIAVLMLLSYLTFIRYSKSDGKGNYYNNTDYFLFQQEGFRYAKGDTALLVDDREDYAILMSGAGSLWIDKSAMLYTKDLELPLYVGEERSREEGIEMNVVNLTKDYAMGNGESLLVRKNDKPLLFIQYVEIPHEKSLKDRLKPKELRPDYDSVMFVFSVNNGPYDTVFKSNFFKGYNLGELLQEGTSTRLDEYGVSFFSKCYLIRSHYKLDASKRTKESDKVYLFADNPIFNDSCQVVAKGVLYSNKAQNEVSELPMAGKYFYLGLGNAKSPVYQLIDEGGSVYVKYRLPIMYHFPNNRNYRAGEAKLFLTTSKDEIIKFRHDYDLFYQFNEQLSENSIYKSSAVMNFRIDSAGVSPNFEFAYRIGEGDFGTKEEIVPGTPFELKTNSCNRDDYDGHFAKMLYVFNVKDMRQNEVYQGAMWLYIIMLGGFFFIYFLLHCISKNENIDNERMNRWFGIETAVYFVLIAFLTVRLVLLWRLHTFPPIENVSFKEFNTLIDKGYFEWTYKAIYGVLGLRILILLCQLNQVSDRGLSLLRSISNIFHFDTWMEFLFSRLEKKKPFGRFLTLIFIPTVIYAILGFVLGRTSTGEVFIKEALAPIVAFAINSVCFVRLVRTDNSENTRGICWWGMLLNSALFLVFLLMPKSMVVGFGEQGMVVPMLALMVLWIAIAVCFVEINMEKEWVGKLARLGCVLFALLVLYGVMEHKGFFRNTEKGREMLSEMPSSRIKARMESLVYSPTEMVQNVEFNEKYLRDIRNASSNKWFIDNHLIEMRRLKEPSDFHLDKEYNQLAVNYITQTRDVLLLRYVIYEHGHGVVRCLLSILALLVITVFVLYKRSDTEMPYLQMLPSQAASFLLVFAGFLYLVNLNAVVFVGLDFPFLSMSSKVAPFGLLLPLLAILLPLHPQYMNESLETEEVDVRKLCGVVTPFVLMLFMLFPCRDMKRYLDEREKVCQVNNDPLKAETFSISMTPLAEFINNYLNPAFKDVQDIQKKEYQKQREENQGFKKVALMDLPVYATDLKDELDSVLYKEHFLNDRLKAYARDITDPRHLNDTAVISSAFKKFFKTSLVDTKSLIHIRKIRKNDKESYFVFAPNKLYYDMKPIFNYGVDEDWSGDLLAAKVDSKIQFEDKTKKKNNTWSIDKNSDNIKLYSTQDKYLKYLTDKDGHLLAELYQIPAKYCYGTTNDVFVVLSKLTSTHSFKILPKYDASKGFSEFFGAQILYNDEVNINGKNSFAICKDDEHYFSLRIHYNGKKHEAIYPMGDDFMFAYNFDRMLAQSKTDSARSPIRISLDYELLESVNKYCRNEMLHKREYGDGIAVTAVDGNGRIRLLADYNPNKLLTIDPNMEKEIEKKMEEIWLNGDDMSQRILLQNRNVTRMPLGPGSTIKVPFYVALLSRLDKIGWDSLCIQFINGLDPEGNMLFTTIQNSKYKTRDMVTHFGNDRVNGIHELYDADKNRVYGWDEMEYEYSNPSSAGHLGPSNFIATSNNFYFSALLMLGAYSSDDLNREDGISEVLELTSQDRVVFPKFLLNGHYYTFKADLLNDILSYNNDPNKLALEAGLENLFRFNINQKKNNLLEYYDRDPVASLFDKTNESDWFNLNAEYVHSTIPSLYRNIDGLSDNNLQEFYNHHFQLTAGGAEQLEVTPLNMAEMYLRIALQNGNEKNLLTYHDGRKVPMASEPMTNDSDISRFTKSMQKTTFKGMYKVIDQNRWPFRGTLRDNRVGGDLKQELIEKGIFIYAKTGTAGGAIKTDDGREQNCDNYHYAFILTNKPLHIDNEDREGLKVYVVYFGYYNGTTNHPGSTRSRDAILHQIINSETFKDYWEE